MLVHDFLKILEKLAPASVAEEWDNVGLQAGSRTQDITSVLVALNINDDVISEAVSQRAGLVITHHPLIFSLLASASEDTVTGRLIARAAREQICIVSAHTNLDSAKGGLADILAEILELRNLKALSGASSGWSKLAVFVPSESIQQVKSGIFDAGAGIIGDYEHCSWSVSGQGSFLPMEGAKPSMGAVGEDETVSEQRLEAVFPSGKQEEIVDALIRNHPYEEPAYDIVPLRTRRRDAGAGRVGDLDRETALADLAGQAAELFGIEEALYTGDPEFPVRRVAIVPGSGAAYMQTAVAQEAQVLITGDLKYHNALTAAEMGIQLIDIPHDASESAALERWVPRLEKQLKPQGVRTIFSRVETNPWRRELRRERVALPQSDEIEMFHLHVDGGSRGNPGPAGIGAVLVDPAGEKVDELSSFIGRATNNVAEYQALISGLEMALDRGVRQLAIFSDSELMVRQINGSYKVKNDGLRPYYQQSKELLSNLEEYELASVPRESNADADRLVNKALDAQEKHK